VSDAKPRVWRLIDHPQPAQRETPVVRCAVKLLRQLLRSDDGPTAIEYAVMLALLITACTWSIQMMGCQVARTFYYATNAMQN
jgi:pilus assembly protein Flp/PilA